MIKRPGVSDERAAGCCLFIFGIPFLIAGVVAGGKTLLNESQLEKILPALLFLFLFGISGLSIAIIGLRKLTNARYLKAPLSLIKPQGSWRENPAFPAIKVRPSLSGRKVLPETPHPGFTFFGLLLFTLFWNGACWFALYKVAFVGNDDVLSLVGTLFIGLFCLIGLCLAWAVCYQMLGMALTGSTTVEVANEPLYPGRAVSVWLHQKGSFAIQRMTVALVCIEEASHGSGSDRTTLKEEVYREIVYDHLDLAANNRMLGQMQVSPPQNAALSFKSGSNQVRWILEVKMLLPGRPDIKKDFQLRVAPEKMP